MDVFLRFHQLLVHYANAHKSECPVKAPFFTLFINGMSILQSLRNLSTCFCQVQMQKASSQQGF